jgi:mono/diheme cytochrome c family protein
MKTAMAIGLTASILLLAPAARAASAPDNWTAHCAKCHGADGAARSKLAHRLGVRDLTSAATQKTFSDEELFTHLKSGEVGPDGKAKMKPFGEVLSDDECHALVAYVRALAKS